MDDLISRQAAIDALSVGKKALSRVLDEIDVVGTDREKYLWGLGLIESSIKDIEELPSAQPEQRTEERTETHSCDSIDRQAAIDALKNNRFPGAPYVDAGISIAIGVICDLPSAHPERTQERTGTHACDLIDREAAVDAIYHHLPSVSRTRARTMLHEVPSAQSDLEAKILAAGYTGKEVRIYIGGRLFGVRELAQ